MGYSIVGCAYTEENIIVRRQPDGMKNATFVDFKEIVKEWDICAVHFNKADPSAFEQKVIALAPDLIIVAGFHYLISSKMTDLPRLGTIGCTQACCPSTGAAPPLTWQIIQGEKTAGLSMFYIGEGTDKGDIIGQEAFDIEEADTIRDLIAKSEIAAVRLLEKYVPLLLAGTASRIQQNENDATYFKQRIPLDGEINWDDSPQNIKNFIRAQAKPYPGAFTYINGKKVIIWDADIMKSPSKNITSPARPKALRFFIMHSPPRRCLFMLTRRNPLYMLYLTGFIKT